MKGLCPECNTIHAANDSCRGRITFGKHRGLSHRELIEQHPSYALWAHLNVTSFSMSPSEIQRCVAATDDPHAPRGGPGYYEDDLMDEFGGRTYSDFGNN